jgi:DNA-binding SARP family transcriptional activator
VSGDEVPSGIDIELFGGPAVLGSQGPIRLSPSQLAFLTLVYANGGMSRPRIARILWKQDDSPSIRHRIRELLHKTNARLGLRGIRPDADQLRPSPEVRCDVADFRAALTASELRVAAELLRAGFATSPLPTVGGEYHDWCTTFGAALTRSLRDRALTAWEEASHQDDWDRARDAAEALYSIEPADERAVMRVIEARARTGKIGSAEAAYATHTGSLSPGESPSRAVEDLIERVRLLRATRDRAGPARQAPFVGRVEAMATARSALDEISAGGFSFVLVSGESGIGKTRLLQELEREAVLRSFRCLRASPVELESIIPLNPLWDALSSVNLRPHLEELGVPWSTVISAALPSDSFSELAADLPPIQERELSRRLLDAFSMLLGRLALEKPTVLFLDDLHWADATTVTALQFFQRRWKEGPFGIVASVRPELVGDADPASQYLVGGDRLEVHKIELGELSNEEAVRLIRGIAGQELEDKRVERICALAGLHPLYLTELTRDYLAGHLKLPELPADEVPIPVSLQQILQARIADLSDSAMRLAGMLAVGMRPIKLESLATLARISLYDCAEYTEELERSRLVEVRRDQVQISHDLFRSALYKQVSDARRAVLHRTFAEHLIGQSPDESPGELAIHFSRAGETERASEYGWIAAERAQDSGAMAEAAHFYHLVAENESDSHRRAEATAGLARALHLNRDLERANPALELAAARLRDVGNNGQARRMDIRRVEGMAALWVAPLPALLERLEAIKSDARTAEDWEAVALALDEELRLLHRAGDIRGIRALFGEMRDTAERGPTAAAVLCHAGLAMQALFGDPADALASANRAVALATQSREHRLTALMRLLVVLQCQGTLRQPLAQEVIDEARGLARRSGDLRAQFSIESNVALSLLDAGELDQAEVVMDRLSGILGSADFDLGRLNQANNSAELGLARHDFEGARNRYIDATRHCGPNTPHYAKDAINAGLGLCALKTGNLAEARRREHELGDAPELWFYDPTTILTFRAEMLEKRGDRGGAIDLLKANANKLRDRHVSAWLKVCALLIRLMIKEVYGGQRNWASQSESRNSRSSCGTQRDLAPRRKDSSSVKGI